MMTLSETAQILNGKLSGTDSVFHAVSTDTRSLRKGDLFVALQGENFDGNDYLDQAQQKGAVGALTNRQIESELASISVDDTLSALQKLAINWRQRQNLALIAVTGSNGKTTVKELIGFIMQASGKDYLISKGNFNNHIGVPLSLLRLKAKHEYAVIEMGMNHAGEISLLSNMAKPDVVVITNAMLAHVQDLKTVEAVAHAKAEIFEGMHDSAMAVLNADDANFTLFKRLLKGRSYIDFGLENQASISAVRNNEGSKTKLTVTTPSGNFDIDYGMPGEHNVINALAATAACYSLDIDLNTIAAGLEKAKPIKGRLSEHVLNNGLQIFDDSYNANPGSMRAGINCLVKQKNSPKIVILGDMAELGDQSIKQHILLGEFAKNAGVDVFLSYGPLMAHATKAFGSNGFNFIDMIALIKKMSSIVTNESSILIKGSRSMRMERVVEILLNENNFGD